MSDAEAIRPGAITRSVENLSTVIRALLPGAAQRPLHAGAVDALIAGIALLAIQCLVYLVAVSPDAAGYGAVRTIAGGVLVQLVLVALVVVLLRRAPDLDQIIVGLLWALFLGFVLALLVSVFVGGGEGVWGMLAYAGPSLIPAILFLLAALGLVGGLAAGLTLIATAAIVFLEWGGVVSWNAQDTSPQALVDTEAVYAQQSALLAAQVRRLRPGNPGEVELFGVLAAGYPYERVFQREVEAVGALLESDFAASGRVLQLVNSVHAPTDYPLLNRGNLTAALDAIGQVMDEDDLLLLFLTSHGGDAILGTEFAGLLTRNLTAADIDRALEASGIENVMLVISACYSGSFSEALTGPSRLLLTAARADRRSFGCSDEAEWTNWGRAFFTEALPKARDPREAALIARDLVAEWEVEQGFPPSEPMIVEGNLIGPVIDDWLATLP